MLLFSGYRKATFPMRVLSERPLQPVISLIPSACNIQYAKSHTSGGARPEPHHLLSDGNTKQKGKFGPFH